MAERIIMRLSILVFVQLLVMSSVVHGMNKDVWHYQKKNHGLINACVISQQEYNRTYPCFNGKEKELSSFRDILSWAHAMKDTPLVADVTDNVLCISYCLSVAHSDPVLVGIVSKHYNIPSFKYYCLDNKHKKTLMHIGLGIQEAVQAQERFYLKAEGIDKQSSKKIYEHMIDLPISIKKNIVAIDGNCIFVQKKNPSLYNIYLGQGAQRTANIEAVSTDVALISHGITTGACFIGLGCFLTAHKKGFSAASGGFSVSLIAILYRILGGCMSLTEEQAKLFALIFTGGTCFSEYALNYAKAKGVDLSRTQLGIAMITGGLIGKNLLKPAEYVSDYVGKSFDESLMQSMAACGFKGKSLLLKNEI